MIAPRIPLAGVLGCAGASLLSSSVAQAQRVTLLASREVRLTLRRGHSRRARVRLRIDNSRPVIVAPRSRRRPCSAPARSA